MTCKYFETCLKDEASHKRSNDSVLKNVENGQIYIDTEV